ncbi:FtsX-like permease family protein [bacterium]|nr:MAG: FtsX-like permease family protein [bacterium]
MTLNESVRIGIEGLLTHRIRSVLTALGIIFGVAAVVAMLSIGEGAKLEALEQIRLMGMNNIIVRSKEISTSGTEKAKASFSPGLVALDAETIREICPGVEQTVPQWEKTTQAQYLVERKEVKVVGTTPVFLDVFGYRIGAGRFLDDAHLEQQENVCVLGSDAKDALFHFENPMGKSIKLDNQWFSVIGVMERQLAPSKKLENLEVRNLNMDIYVPLTTAQYKMERYKASGSGNVRFFGGGVSISSTDRTPVPRFLLDQITIKVSSERVITSVTDIARRILERRHYGMDDYEIIVPEALVQQSQKTQQIFNVVMGAIAGISLLVGGIGIMNIMLASVMERTKEIGVRRAVGATRVDVLGQFLFEATFLSVIGGLAGILLGYALTQAITFYAEWRTVVSLEAIILAFTVSAGVGISFGYYPARKAAFQNPIESLRYE